MSDLTRELADRLIKACDRFPYHELCAYAEGVTIGELRDWLERGAIVGEKDRDPQKQELRRFTQLYCQADAAFAAKSFRLFLGEGQPESVKVTRGGHIINSSKTTHVELRGLWTWFEKRWPCGNPLAIGTLLSSARVEELSLADALSNPNAEIQAAITRAQLFRVEDLEEPPEWLRSALASAGWSQDAEPDEGPPTDG